MRIGIPAEVYPGETRVAATPETVKKLTAGGRHSVVVQSGAGVHSAVRDSDYQTAGATIAQTAGEVYGQADNSEILRLLKMLGVEILESDIPEYNWKAEVWAQQVQ